MRSPRRSPSGLFLADGEVTTIREALRALADRALALPAAEHELFDSARELRPVVLAVEVLLTEASEAFSSLADAMDRFAESTSSVRQSLPALTGLDAAIQRLRDPGHVAGLCFLACFVMAERRSEIARLLARLENGDGVDLGWEAIETTHGAAREVVKAVSGVDLALCAATNAEEGQPFFVTAVQQALDTRHAFVSFRASLDAGVAAGPEVLPARLRRATTAIVKLQGRPVYPWLRVGDRRSLRTLHGRLVQWVKTHAAAPDRAALLEGGRLFQECANLGEIFLAVNKRQELRAFDHHVLTRARERLARGESLVALRASLASIEGRDDALDASVRSDDPGALSAHLERVLATLDVDATLQMRWGRMLDAVAARASLR